MKKQLTLGLIALAMAATTSLAAARSYRGERVAVTLLSPDEILASVQIIGLVPTVPVLRRGPFYVLHAFDRQGTEFSVVADAAFGDIVDVTPIFIPRLDGGPRIIHVPQPGDHAPARHGRVKAAPARN